MRILFFVLALAFTGLASANVYDKAWAGACRLSGGDCDGLARPYIVWVDALPTIDGVRSIAGGYDLQKTIYLSRKLATSAGIETLLVHEYTHYILHITGVLVIILGDIDSICASEAAAYKTANRYALRRAPRYVNKKWRAKYPQCIRE